MSREADLYKDKIEVSLDGRQIFYLFFGGSVIVGLVFVLGVMVGRRVEARGHTDRARVAATVDPLAALDRLEGGNGLSFQGALRGGDAPASDVEKQIAAMQAEAKDAAKGDAKKKSEPKAESIATQPKTEAKPEAKADEPKKTEDKKSEAKKSDAKAEAKSSDTEDKTAETKKSDDAKKTETAKKDDSEKKDDVEKKDEKKRFTLQLSSFQDKHEAEAYLDSIKSHGYSAHMTEGTVDGKQYYRVRLGTYKSMDAANEAKAELEKATKKSAIVTRL